MIELGKREEFSNLESILSPLQVYGKPGTFPRLKEGEVVICEYNQFAWKKLYWCQNLQDMQQIWESADSGGGFVSWYKVPWSFVDQNAISIHPFEENP